MDRLPLERPGSTDKHQAVLYQSFRARRAAIGSVYYATATTCCVSELTGSPVLTWPYGSTGQCLGRVSSLSPRFTPGSNLSAHLETLPGPGGLNSKEGLGREQLAEQSQQGLTVAGSEYPAAVALGWMDGWIGLESLETAFNLSPSPVPCPMGLHSPSPPFSLL